MPASRAGEERNRVTEQSRVPFQDFLPGVNPGSDPGTSPVPEEREMRVAALVESDTPARLDDALGNEKLEQLYASGKSLLGGRVGGWTVVAPTVQSGGAGGEVAGSAGFRIYARSRDEVLEVSRSGEPPEAPGGRVDGRR
ncbi:MAG: hypothetical protein HQM02_01775 [Magnetococcales bacterium]|nr:hypothetical protein [Magnetococcales bacterium]